MPIYDNSITMDDLKEVLNTIKTEMRGCKSIFSFYFCIQSLYEYCQCYSYMKINNVDTIKNAKVTVDSIKTFIPRTTEFAYVCNIFMKTRNALGHIFPEYLRWNYIQILLSSTEFYNILSICDVDEDIIILLRNYCTDNHELKESNIFN